MLAGRVGPRGRHLGARSSTPGARARGLGRALTHRGDLVHAWTPLRG